jgi:hypothetical protein
VVLLFFKQKFLYIYCSRRHDELLLLIYHITALNTPNKTTTIVGSNLQANANNANNAVNTANTNNGQININSQNLNILLCLGVDIDLFGCHAGE